jgi:hypothetical protein
MRTSLRAFLSLVVLSCMAQHSHGQIAKVEYINTPPAIDPKKLTATENYLNGKLTGPDAAAAAATVPLLVRHEMAKLTEKYDGNKLPKFKISRDRINSWLTAPNQSAEARAVLIAELNTVAIGLATNANYLPAHRINAVYILGDLDEARDSKAGTRTPYKKATGNLLQILNDANQVNFVKVPALAALERHVRDGWKAWPDNQKSFVRKAVAAYANNKPKDDLDRAVNSWMVRRSMDILRLMEANDAVDSALAYLADPKELPSLRGSSLEYLQALDPAKFDASQKQLYMLGLVHYLRSQLVDWYQIETDHSKRKTMGGFGGGMGMGPGGMDPGGMGPGSMGDMMGSSGDMGMGPGSMGDMMGMSGDGYGDAGMGSGGRGAGAGTAKPKLIDLQDWQTRVARRRLNEVSQSVHKALDGKRLSADPVTAISKLHLSKPDVTFEEDFKLSKLITLVDDLQKAVNDPNRVRTITSLMNFTKMPIEEIMDYSKKLPGFLEKYPELKNDDDELEQAIDPPKQPTDGGKTEGEKSAPDAGASGDDTKPKQ